jgi:predicted N-acetyltransferase YhbS
LVGDPPYFSRFGFLPAPEAVLSGPVDRRRVMWLPITEVAPVGLVRSVA